MAGVKPRVIVVTKCEGHSFGFFLRVEQGEEGHLIRNLEMGGAAELAGMKDGDRLIRVNGTFVDNLDHSQVAELVRKGGMSVTFHILGAEAYKQAKAGGVDLSELQKQPTANGVSSPTPKAKLCYLQKSSKDFGFSIKSTKGENGIYMLDITPSGVADEAGVRANDRLLEINGENVEGGTHDQVVEKLKAAGNSIMLLLVDEAADRYYKNTHIRLGVGLATVKLLPLKPRLAEMTRSSDGYGYYLRELSKVQGHFIRDIDRGSPAEKAGLRDMDRLVAVDGEDVEKCTHEQVVDKIRQRGNKCCLLVVDSETDKMYKLGGASPLLFLDELGGSLPQPSQPESIRELVPQPVPVLEDDHKPKLCCMEKTASGYGFHLNGIQGICGQCIKEVVPGGAADRAGLEDEDVVVEVDGVNVEEKTHEEVVMLIRNSGDSLRLLVASKGTYDLLKAKGIAITTQLLAAAPDPAPSTPDPAPAQQDMHEEQEETSRPATPPSPARERTSSSSSSESQDERL